MKFQIKGKVEKIGQTQSFGSNGFTKREIVLDTTEAGSKYSSHAVIEFMKDKCQLLDGIPNGATATVDFFVDAREWNGRWFVSLKGAKIAVEGLDDRRVPEPAEPDIVGDDSTDEMPF